MRKLIFTLCKLRRSYEGEVPFIPGTSCKETLVLERDMQQRLILMAFTLSPHIVNHNSCETMYRVTQSAYYIFISHANVKVKVCHAFVLCSFNGISVNSDPDECACTCVNFQCDPPPLDSLLPICLRLTIFFLCNQNIDLFVIWLPHATWVFINPNTLYPFIVI